MGSLTFKNQNSLHTFRETSKSIVTTLHTRTCSFCGKRKDPIGASMVVIPNSSKRIFKCKSCTEKDLKQNVKT